MENTHSESSMVMEEIAGYFTDSEVLDYMYSRDINWRHVLTLSKLTDTSDMLVSGWLNVNVKTFREYRKSGAQLKENIKEHVLLLLSLMKHGHRIFGTKDLFDRWLSTPNFFFDGRQPSALLHTVTGIRFVSDRLSAIEYGDNV
jgi:hypothetical protein